MAITVPDNMSYGGKKPNFDRDQFATLAAMNSFASDFLDEGHISYCVETKKHYKWTGTKWEEFKSAGEASQIAYSGKVGGSNVKDALDEVGTRLGNIESGTSGGGGGASISKGDVSYSQTAQPLLCDINVSGNKVSPVKYNGTVGSATIPVYMNGGKPTPITSFGEAYLSWGGKSYTGYGPIDAALVDVLRANRFDGLPAKCITVEYSRDGGATWVDYEATDKQKVDLVSQTPDSANLDIGKSDTDNPVNANHKLRVIINSQRASATSSDIYSELRKFIVYASESKVTFQTTCTIKKRAQSDYAAGNDVWTIVSENVRVFGWSGYNVINTPSIITYGNQDIYSREIMFEFSIGNPPSSGRGFSILKIFAYGGVGWITPSNMAARGHLYSYDYLRNARFPAKVNAAGGLQENGTNLGDKYLGINATANSAKSISDGTNSYTPSAIKTMETNLEDAISDIISIDTSLFPTSTDEVIGFRQTNGGDGVGYSEAWLDRLKGDTVVWNQTYPTGWTINNQGVTSVSTNGLITLNGTTATTHFNIKNGVGYSDIPTNHTGLYVLKVIKDDNKYLQGKRIGLLNRGVSAAIDNNFASFFHTNQDTKGWSLGFFLIANGDVITDIQIRVAIYDLTQMFGAGKEPTTIEEFNARKPLGVTDDYNEGELISTTADEFKSVGFNLLNICRTERPFDKFHAPTSERVLNEGEFWNGFAYNGYYNKNNILNNIVIDNNTISAVQASTTVGNAGYGLGFPFRALPNTKYSWRYTSSNSVIRVGFFNKEGVNIGFANETPFTTKSDTEWLVVIVSPNSSSTRIDISDICIHLVHTGTRNGEYEPYKEYRLPLPIKDIKDKDGNQLFPNGLLSAGTVYDEITATKAIKRIGVVDMGTLSWARAKAPAWPADLLYAEISDAKKGTNIGGRMARYSRATNIATIADKHYITGANNKYVYVRDDSYTSASAFKAAMSGVMLYYELAEPIEVDIEEWDRRYEVSDFGTEEVISDTPSTPLKADIIYEYNAKARIEANERKSAKNESDIEKLIQRITELENKLASYEQSE